MKKINIVLLPLLIILSCCKDPEPAKPVDNTPKSNVVITKLKLVYAQSSFGTYPQNEVTKMKVTLNNAKYTFSTVPDASGNIKFQNIPLGYYTLSFVGSKFISYSVDSILVANPDTSYLLPSNFGSIDKTFTWTMVKPFYVSISGLNVSIKNDLLSVIGTSFKSVDNSTHSFDLHPTYLVSNNRKMLNYWKEFRLIKVKPEIKSMFSENEFLRMEDSNYYKNVKYNEEIVDTFVDDNYHLHGYIVDYMKKGDTIFVKAIPNSFYPEIIGNEPVGWCLKE